MRRVDGDDVACFTLRSVPSARTTAVFACLVVLSTSERVHAGPEDIPPPVAYVPPDPVSTATELFNHVEVALAGGVALYDTPTKRYENIAGNPLVVLTGAYRVSRVIAFGVSGQMAIATSDTADPSMHVVDGHAWATPRWRIFRPSLGLGLGVIWSAGVLRAAWTGDLFFGFCLVGYADPGCTVTFGPALGLAEKIGQGASLGMFTTTYRIAVAF